MRILAAPMSTAGGNVRWLCALLFPGMPEAEALALMASVSLGADGAARGRRLHPLGAFLPVRDRAARVAPDGARTAGLAPESFTGGR